MRELQLADIVDLDTYERVRPSYRQQIIRHKQTRRVGVGPRVSVLFEDRETLRYQIQEMTRVERTSDLEKVQIELDVYNDLIPGRNELSATLFIEIPELSQIRSELDRLIGIDEHVALVIDAGGREATRAAARFDERQMEEDRISAVHYLRFSLTEEQAERFGAGARVSLQISHPHYQHEAELGPATRESLLRDLHDSSPELLDPAALQRARAAAGAAVVETASVRARILPSAGAGERTVVETRDETLTFATADPAVVAELVGLAQRVAREMELRAGSCRIQMDARTGESGGLRLELSAPADADVPEKS
jgi:hypothetical protein